MLRRNVRFAQRGSRETAQDRQFRSRQVSEERGLERTGLARCWGSRRVARCNYVYADENEATSHALPTMDVSWGNPWGNCHWGLNPKGITMDFDEDWWRDASYWVFGAEKCFYIGRRIVWYEWIRMRASQSMRDQLLFLHTLQIWLICRPLYTSHFVSMNPDLPLVVGWNRNGTCVGQIPHNSEVDL